MIRNLFNLFIGVYQIEIDAENKTTVSEIMMKHGIGCVKSEVLQGGNYILLLNIFSYKALIEELYNKEIQYKLLRVSGSPVLFDKLKKRPGFILGILFFVLINIYLSRVVWLIEISGNSTIPDYSIINGLEEIGFGYGTYLPSTDFDVVNAVFLAENEDIAWISVNMRGTHAYVEVIEAIHTKENSKNENVGANVIASEDGQIYLTKADSGIMIAHNGDIVRKGELLISGVIPMRDDRMRFDYASGQVLAYVSKTIEVKIPFEREEKTYTGAEKVKKSIKIFKKEINLFPKGGIKYTFMIK